MSFPSPTVSNILKANSCLSRNVTSDTVTVESLVVDTITAESLNSKTVKTNTISVGNKIITEILKVDSLKCKTLTANNIITSEYNISTLYANDIAALQTAQITDHRVVDTATAGGLTTAQIILISIGVLLVLATIVTLGAALAASAAVITAEAEVAGTAFLFEAEAFTPEEGLIVDYATLGLEELSVSIVADVAVAATPAVVSGSSIAIGAAVVGSGIIGAGTLIAAAILPANKPYQPTLRPFTLNAAYGNAFFSDCIFGTTSYVDATASYVNFLLIQNELNGSYALPRIIGYNPQLGFFDDYQSYGGVKAYLSICTDTPYMTLRYNENGNLAIYNSVNSSPVWESGTQVSSLKYKTNVKKIENSIDKINTLDGVYFDYKGTENSRDIGVIAQQVEKILPEAVFGNSDSGYRVRLERLVPLLIEGMKELYLKQQEILLAQTIFIS